jgi:hypothetical protein
MWMWIANDISYPVKTYIYTTLVTDGTQTEILYNSEMKGGTFDRGSGEIPWDTCTQTGSDGHYHRRNPGFEYLEWSDGEYLPKIGANSTNFEFHATEAISEAQSQSTEFSSYLGGNPGAYLVDGYYNETQNPLWNLTFGEKGDDLGYYVVLEYDDGSFDILDEGELDISDVRNSTDDYESVLTISGSYKVFQTDSIATQEAFDVNGVKFYEDIRFGMQHDIVYPTISLTISLAIERTEYGYSLNNEDGSFSAAVDAINGQLIYTWEHEGDDVLSFLLGA